MGVIFDFIPNIYLCLIIIIINEKSSAQISYKIRLEVGIARTHAGIIWVFDGRFV